MFTLIVMFRLAIIVKFKIQFLFMTEKFLLMYLLDQMHASQMIKFQGPFNKDWKISKTIVEQGASLGANSTIICGVRIGEYAMIGAGAVVTKDVPPYTLVIGNPAREYGKVDKNGNKIS